LLRDVTIFSFSFLLLPTSIPSTTFEDTGTEKSRRKTGRRRLSNGRKRRRRIKRNNKGRRRKDGRHKNHVFSHFVTFGMFWFLRESCISCPKIENLPEKWNSAPAVQTRHTLWWERRNKNSWEQFSWFGLSNCFQQTHFPRGEFGKLQFGFQ
jgi:hypothetical protein